MSGYQEAVADLRRGLRTAVRNNASAYGYSVMITGTFGALQLESPPLSGGRLFLYAVGAALAFTVVEAVASDWFRNRMRPERSEVVVLGAALNGLSIIMGLGAGYGIARTGWGWPAWLLAPLAATAAYVLVAGVEMALARRAESED